MILAVPEVKMGRFHINASETNFYDAQVVWWYFACTSCGRTGLDVPARSSAPIGALQQGEHHEERYQCQDGQLSLFAVSQ